MVTITDYRVQKNSAGKSFCSLILQGDMELVQSNKTGNFYATAKKASITSTFDENVCKSLIGKTLPGRIEKVESDPYEYIIPERGETIVLQHSYKFIPEKGVEQEVFG